jgi:hypothetical protein
VDATGTCPDCGSSWRAGEIADRPGEFYSRLIGVEYSYDSPNHYDGISEWRCPDCGARWGRFSGRRLGEGESERRP